MCCWIKSRKVQRKHEKKYIFSLSFLWQKWIQLNKPCEYGCEQFSYSICHYHPSIHIYKTERVNAWLLIKWISFHTATAVNDSHTENNKKTEENRISFLSFRSLYGILISNMLKQLVSVKAHIYIKLRDNPILLIWINIRTFFYVPMPIYGECCVLCVR